MIIIFISDKFYLNNIHSDEKCVVLASTEDSIISEYGIAYNENITLEKGNNYTSYYNVDNGEIETKILQFYLVDEFYNPMIWEENRIKDIVDWIVTDDFVPFISEDNLEKVYFFKCKSIKKMFNWRKQGYLEVEFQPVSQYSYRTFNIRILVIDKKELPFYNYSNVVDFYKPIIEIENLGNENNVITIKNTTTGDEEFSITGLKNMEKVIIDNQIGYVVNSNDVNLISKCNRKWVRLSKNTSNLEFKGNCNITIKAQFPIRG